MIRQDDIQAYIRTIPPSPLILKKVLQWLEKGELTKAAAEAAEDPALKLYLQNIVNKPIYGFKNDIKAIGQIFGILGLAQAEQIVYNYMISLLAPSRWELFALSHKDFGQIQDNLGVVWKSILEHKNINEKEIYSAISLLPAAIIVCEALFKEKKEEVSLLRSTKEIDYNTILKRLSGMDLFDLCAAIAAAWEMPEIISKIVLCSRGMSDEKDEKIIDLSKWMHLLFFHQLSQSAAAEAGLNDFIAFNIDYVEDIYEEFQEVVIDNASSR